MTGLIASTYFMVSITLERFVVVYWPLRSRNICTVKNAWKTSGIITAFSVLYSVPGYFESYVDSYMADDNVTTIYRTRLTPFARSDTYQILYLKWGYTIFNYVLPFSILIIFNIAVSITVSSLVSGRISLRGQLKINS